MSKFVYFFEEGNKSMKNLLGGKGANLSEMIKMGLPVPSGFIISTDACIKFYDDNKILSDEIKEEIEKSMLKLEEKTNKKFGDIYNPLLVSVRSGARVSMPGMMDTILNLGINDEIAIGFSKDEQSMRFIYDSYRRFIQMFSNVVKGLSTEKFENIIETIKKNKNIENDRFLDANDLKQITEEFKKLYKQLSKEAFPQDPKEQIIEAITAVFRSWNNERAIYYRKMNNIPSAWGTAVNIQEMVYGNKGENCGTGVAFTRNPSTGEKKIYGEFLMNAQGEDVVAGIRTPEDINKLKELMPEVYNQFIKINDKLEKHYLDMQDMEFTIEDGKLYMLQTRNGKRTATADLKIAIDLVSENMISKQEAILKVEPRQLDNLLHPIFDKDELKKAKIITTGLAASPGAASGKIVFSADDVINSKDKNLILVRLETSPEDIEAMNKADGILTIRGGMTSHAAVVARGMGKCCVSGCGDLTIDYNKKILTTKDGLIFKEYDFISLDGSNGNVYEGNIKTVKTTTSDDFKTFMSWVDEIKTMKVRANADSEEDAKTAIEFGAEGIGLCRTEHMFFEENRIFVMRQMIMAKTEEQRQEALNKLLPMQQKDFEKLYTIMDGKPVTIRYLDPPLHEFLPTDAKDIKELAESLNITIKKLKDHMKSLHESNPMMGHRGCRLSITYPEIAEMQTKALINAAIKVKKNGINVMPEIMIPLIGDGKELKYIKDIVIKTANNILKESDIDLHYLIGTMIEVPRATIMADEIALDAEFFSFGTNDLTQMTYGFSRDDSAKFLDDYYKKQIFDFDPFIQLDQKGVGKLIKTAIKLGKMTRPNLKIGICGEHGGEPTSVEYCHSIGFDYVSCSPYRIPIAKLAAAQAKIKETLNIQVSSGGIYEKQ